MPDINLSDYIPASVFSIASGATWIGLIVTTFAFAFLLLYVLRRGLRSWNEVQSFLVLALLILTIPLLTVMIQKSNNTVTTQAKREAKVVSIDAQNVDAKVIVTLTLDNEADVYLKVKNLATQQSSLILPDGTLSGIQHTFTISNASKAALEITIYINGKPADYPPVNVGY